MSNSSKRQCGCDRPLIEGEKNIVHTANASMMIAWTTSKSWVNKLPQLAYLWQAMWEENFLTSNRTENL